MLAPIGNRTVPEETLLTFTATATDPDLPPQTLTFSLSGAPAGAALDPVTGVFTWTPTEAQGPGQFTFDLCVSDGALTDCETLTITVTEVNRPPVARDDSYTTAEDTPMIVSAPGVLTNDTDSDGDPLSAILVTGPTHGQLTLNNNGGFTYNPNPNFNGTDLFTYRVTDGPTSSAPATVTITVTPVAEQAATIIVQVNPAFLVANSGATAPVTATVLDSEGYPLPHITLWSSLTPLTMGSLVLAGETNEQGQLYGTWTAGTLPGSGLILVTNGTITGTAAIGLVEGAPPVYKLYLPVVFCPPMSDLIPVSLSIEPATPAAGQWVTISLTIQNQGITVTNATFRIDLYIDPAIPPTTAGQPWSAQCAGAANCYGGVWYVTETLAPDENITLISTALVPDESNWPGRFNRAGNHTIYAFVDSEPGYDILGDLCGGIQEIREDNNLIKRVVTVTTVAAATDRPQPPNKRPPAR